MDSGDFEWGQVDIDGIVADGQVENGETAIINLPGESGSDHETEPDPGGAACGFLDMEEQRIALGGGLEFELCHGDIAVIEVEEPALVAQRGRAGFDGYGDDGSEGVDDGLVREFEICDEAELEGSVIFLPCDE